MNSTQQTTTKQYFFTQTLVYIALIMGQLVFGLVVFYLRSTQPQSANSAQVFLYMAPILAGAGLVGGNMLFRFFLKKANEKSVLKDKIMAYSQATLVRYALLEAPSLFSIIAYFLTGYPLFIGIAGFMIGSFLFVRPTKDRLMQDLQLTPSEESIVNDPDAILTERSFPNRR